MDHNHAKLFMALTRAYNQSMAIGNMREDAEYHQVADDITRLIRRLRIMQITRKTEAMPE